MNRVIKFRAWDKRMSRMLSDATPMRGSIWWNDGACFDSCGKEYDVMQFTGLCDKNGREIYEGDICGYAGSEDDPPFSVVFENAAFRKSYAGWDQTLVKPLIDESDIRLLGIEVIGNIYENSDLLSR